MNKTIYRFALISIGAATITIILKLAAWWVTDSVGFLSDALESVVNLVGAIVALGDVLTHMKFGLQTVVGRPYHPIKRSGPKTDTRRSGEGKVRRMT